MENSTVQVPQKSKNQTTIWSTKSHFWVFIQRKWNQYPKKHLHPHGHGNIIHKSQDQET